MKTEMPIFLLVVSDKPDNGGGLVSVYQPALWGRRGWFVTGSHNS